MSDSMEVDEIDLEDQIEPENELPRGEKRKRSVLWKYFIPVTHTRAKCTLCHLVFSYKTSISNLKIHIQRKHNNVALPGIGLLNNKQKFPIKLRKRPRAGKPTNNGEFSDQEESKQSENPTPNLEKKEPVLKDSFIFGSSDISTIVDKSWYVDKTLFIRTTLKECDRLLLTAPRHCGKSTNINMLKKFIEIEVNNNGNPVKLQMGTGTRLLSEQQMSKNFNIFTDKKIYNITRNGKKIFHRTFFTKHFGKYPVMYISFKNITGDTYEEILGSLRSSVYLTYQQHKYLTNSRIWDLGYSKDIFLRYIDFDQYDKIPEEKFKDSLRYLSELLCAHFDTENKVYVLMDELDTPINEIIYNKDFSDNDFKRIVKFIRTLLSCLFKDNPYIERVLAMACHHYADILISDRNFIHKPYLQSENFARYSGLTNEEVESLLANVGLSENAGEVKVWYNSYGMNDGTLVEIYNNWSVMQYLYERDLKNYSPLENLTRMKTPLTCSVLRDKIEILMSRRMITIKYKEKLCFEDAVALKNMLNVPGYHMNEVDVHLFFQFLYEAGYLNLLSRTEETLELAIPNIEIYLEYCRIFFSFNFFVRYYNVTDDRMESFVKAVTDLKTTKDRETFIQLANSIKGLFQNAKVLPQNDFELQAPLHHFLKRYFPNIKGEALTMPKRYLKCDIGLPVDDNLGIVIELTTYDRGTSLGALKQIVSNKYNEIFCFDALSQEIYIGLHMSEDRKISLSYLVNNLDMSFTETISSL